MQARTLTIVTVLLDLKNAFLQLFREKHKNPALILTYAFIDVCAALAQWSPERLQRHDWQKFM